jgi:hypothetical protein
MSMKPLVMMMSVSVAALALSVGAWAGDAHALDPAWVAAAKTPAEHEAVAKAYDAEALGFEKKAAMHKNLAETYGAPGGKPFQAAQAKHCDSVAASLTAAAQEDRALAAGHRKMAKEAAP